MDPIFDPIAQILLGAIGWLDGLPAYARAMLAAALLAALLRGIESNIDATQSRFGESLRKGILFALILFPAFVWLTPESRFVVYTETPDDIAPQRFNAWLLLLVPWALGSAYCLLRLLLSKPNDNHDNSPVDSKTTKRVAHWQRRLGLARTVEAQASLPVRNPLRRFRIDRAVVVIVVRFAQ